MTKRALLLFAAVIGICINTPMFLGSCSSGIDCKDPANANSASCVASTTIEDCTASDLSGALEKYGPIVENEIANAPRKADGSIDWSSIAGTLETQVAEAGFCVISEIFSKYLLAPGNGSVSKLRLADPVGMRSEFEKLRAEHSPGKKIKTSHGLL